MLGGHVSPSMVVRGIIKRGGEQGAQHSQALHSWYAHIPGLRVVMPATPADARDLMIAAVQSPDPVLYIDDRWLYDWEDELAPAADIDLNDVKPAVRREGGDITIVAAGFSVRLALQAAEMLKPLGIECEVLDLRVLNPFDASALRVSVGKTGRLIAVDGGWETCGLAGEGFAGAMEGVPLGALKASPVRITLPHAPAPTSKPLEQAYYTTPDTVVAAAIAMIEATKPV